MNDHTPAGAWRTRFTLMAIATVYAASFVLPVTDANTPQVMWGYQAFLGSLVSVVYWPMWMANPVIWFGGIQYLARRWDSARNAGLIATVLGISEVWLWDDLATVGYFAWIGSMILLSVAAFVEKAQENRMVAALHRGDDAASGDPVQHSEVTR